MNEIVHKLTRGQSHLVTYSIVGMGGTGKSTLAKCIHDNSSVVHRFDIRGWVVVSQEFNVKKLLLVLLREFKALENDKDLDEHQLREKLHKHLFGRRYLIVVDDVWVVEALDKLKLSFPDNHNGSRILVTTRMTNVATHFCESGFIHKMNFLDERRVWKLFSAMLFAKEGCPPELKEIAEMLARNCKGLLLALSVLGGLLANSDITQEYLENIARDTMAIVNSNDEEHCLKILSTSYDNLPVHLRPCFLYLGVFEEDALIPAGELMRLWVSEGLLKPNKTKSMEEVADDYLKDLIGRNLIFVTKFELMGDVKYCRMHDLVRDLCLRKARKESFAYVTKFENPGTIPLGFDNHRRIAVHSFDKYKFSGELEFTSQSSLCPRSLICEFGYYLILPFDVKLLRVLRTTNGAHLGYEEYKGFNLRLISCGNYAFPSSMHLFWNLQTLYSSIRGHRTNITAPSAIWKIPQLRHVVIDPGFYLSDPLVKKKEGQDDVVLENLQELGRIYDFTCTKEVLRKFPNVKTLSVVYKDLKKLSTNCLKNLDRLQKLETLRCEFDVRNLSKRKRQFSIEDWPKSCELVQTLKFPLSLNDLCLTGLRLYWEDIVGKIGSLPHLEQLEISSCKVPDDWETVEGQFLHLKSLKLYFLHFERWKTDGAHFPCLEHLQIETLSYLKEIPHEIGDIPTLQSIALSNCSSSVYNSAKAILEEQRSLGNEDLIVTIEGARVRLGGE